MNKKRNLLSPRENLTQYFSVNNQNIISGKIRILLVFAIFLTALSSENLFAANQMAIDSYSFKIVSAPLDSTSPYTLGHLPLKSAVEVSAETNIIVHIKDDGAGVDINSIKMSVNGQIVSPVISGTPSEYVLNYNPSTNFAIGQQVFVTIQASDLAP
ncbi:MAG: hypothetical protein KJ915_06595 [Candidatus Omnitrophica bacterium]|nr:hypothetical protein [Candidatus Omnitrophota bacterium]